MELAATIISIIALGISIASFIIALYNSYVDRKIQVEQIKGKMTTRLTSRTLDLITQIRSLEKNPIEGKETLASDLATIAYGMTKVSQGISKLPAIPPLIGSFIIPKLHEQRNDIEEIESIFEKLNRAIINQDVFEIEHIIKILEKRIFSSENGESKDKPDSD